jgi:hypothetical protein
MRIRNLTKLAGSAALMAALTILAVSMSITVQSVAASNAQSGQFHIIKDCSDFAKNNLPYCTIVSSSLLPEIPPGVVGNPSAGSLVIYDQPGNNWAGMLDSNVVLYVGVADWATGRCTLNSDGSGGLCTFSDGVGQLAGFTARVNVTYAPTASNPYLFAWDGTYTLKPLPSKSHGSEEHGR